jgi:hypothetical protein
MQNKHYLRLFFLPAIAVAWMTSCENKPKINPKPTPAPTQTEGNKPYLAPPDFNADSAYAFISKQVGFGPRIPNSESQKKCAEWLEKKLKQYTPHVIVQTGTVTAHTGESLRMYNIMARFKPESSNRVLLCAHWDTRPFADMDEGNKNRRFDGADDGGSGTGVLLEIARQIAQKPTDAGIDIVLFDVEDYGTTEGGNESYCLGSQYWSKNPPVPGYFAKYGILLDMVGAKGARFAKEGFSMQVAPSVVEKVWSAAARLGYADLFTQEMAPGVTDDHYFVRKHTGIPVIDIINYGKHNGDNGFGAHWHTGDDNLTVIDKTVLKAVGQTVLDVIYNE